MLLDAAWHARMACVLSGALRLWELDGTVERDPDEPGAFVLRTSGGAQIRIVHHAPHGWRVLRDDTVHAGLPGLLRYLREELAPNAARGRLIIGSSLL